MKRKFGVCENEIAILLGIWFKVLVFIDGHAGHHVVFNGVATMEAGPQLTPDEKDAFVISGAARVVKIAAGFWNEPLDGDKGTNIEVPTGLVFGWSDELSILGANVRVGLDQTLNETDNFLGDVEEALACLRDSFRVAGTGHDEKAEKSE